MCLYPRLIKNRKYTDTKKNGGNIPAVPDERVKYVPIGCQHCIECKKQKARAWQARLTEDIKTNTNAQFITLTIDDENISKLYNELPKSEGYDKDNDAATLAVGRFLERWRKKYKKSVRHWLITELGHHGTENIHLHGLLWTNENQQTIQQIWQYGYIWQGTWVNDQTINYIIKYVLKQDQQHKNYNQKILTSAGIGSNYTNQKHGDWNNNKFNNEKTNETYKTRQGTKINLPIYWRNKIYTEEQKEQLWLQKLDKQERWVMGQKISTKDGDQNYEKALKWAQEKNTRLGYDSPNITWERAQYEQQRRNLKQAERIAKAQQKKLTKSK